ARTLFYLDIAAHAAPYTPSLHGALPISRASARGTQRSSLPTEPASPSTSGSSVRPSSSRVVIRWSGGDGAEGLAELACLGGRQLDRKSTRLNSSHVKISYAVFCLKKKKI